MTDPPVPADGLDEGTLAFAGRMFDLARNGGDEELAEQVDAGLPVNLTNDKGDTLLILAAYHQHAATLRALLARGADTSRVNDKGQTALAAAVFRRSGEIVSDLLAAGADAEVGSPSARETATFFELDDMSALLPPRQA